uniref:Uncharacterized protein n=1 Tax=Picea glauca TaxID=3330 RepID=A0A117NI18_PICGL|nr:hypothetical protein ABT39_MTgene3816 [Picea glauca]QHR90826.1 hypothetical protein Q903MT_gene4852 [Picea sitchensis]
MIQDTTYELLVRPSLANMIQNTLHSRKEYTYPSHKCLHLHPPSELRPGPRYHELHECLGSTDSY